VPTRLPVTDGDREFLFAVFAEATAPEFDALGLARDALEPLLQMQFEAQERSHRAAHPSATFELVLIDGEPAGRLYVDRSGPAIELLEIGLLEAHRGRGAGTELVRELLDEAASTGRPVRLHVARGSAAVRLYERLGFVVSDGDELYLQMQATPTPTGYANTT
jgi:ribosomal protein S18 acetylase RimI-like enzyme